VRDQWPDRLLLPAHPWELEYLQSQPEVADLFERGALVDLGPLGDPVTPTTRVISAMNSANAVSTAGNRRMRRNINSISASNIAVRAEHSRASTSRVSTTSISMPRTMNVRRRASSPISRRGIRPIDGARKFGSETFSTGTIRSVASGSVSSRRISHRRDTCKRATLDTRA
jgi:hypothetical protein